MDPLTIARFEEGAQADVARILAPDAIELGDGAVATYSEPGSWLNRAWNLGLQGPVSGNQLDALVSFFAEHGAAAKLAVCSLGDSSLTSGLAERAFALEEFANVFAKDLRAGTIDQPVAWPPGLHIEVVDPNDEQNVDRWVRASVSGFHEGEDPPEALAGSSRRIVQLPNIVAMIASIDGRPAGGTTLALPEASDPVKGAGLFGTSVRAEFRGRGIQQLLMFERLRMAQEKGARVATISSRPGIPTERNAIRLGFSLSYVKVVMSRAAT